MDMKKLVYCCSVIAALGMFLASSARASGCPSWCSQNGVTCKTGYTCDKCVQTIDGNCTNSANAECTFLTLGSQGRCQSTNPGTGWSSSGFSCASGLTLWCYNPAMAKAGVKANGQLAAKRVPASSPSSWVASLLDVIAAPAHASNCWSGGNNFGFRNNGAQTDVNGTSRNCEAKLHVCFTSGSSDAAIPCTISTTGGCDNACSNVSNIACNVTDVNGLTYCQSRCYAARVNGYSDTCD